MLTVTRISKEMEQIKKLKVKRKSISNNSDISIYEFENFENFIELCNYLKLNIDSTSYLKLKKSKLYKLNSKYYLVLDISSFKLDSFKLIHCSFIEFSKYISNSDLFARKLNEYGSIIIKTNAIDKCISKFYN